VLLLLAAVELVSGFGVMVLDVSVGALMALLVPNDLRSRVSGAYMLVNYGVRPVGAVAGGILGSLVGVRPAMAVGAAIASCAVLPLVRSPVLRLREGRAEPARG
jgi:MFS family permease